MAAFIVSRIRIWETVGERVKDGDTVVDEWFDLFDQFYKTFF